MDENSHVNNYPPQYLAAQVISKEWVQPVDAIHKLFKVSSDVKDKDGNTLVTAYALERPDGQWSVMLVNKDHDNDHSVKVTFADSVRKQSFFARTRSARGVRTPEYQWHPDPAHLRALAGGLRAATRILTGRLKSTVMAVAQIRCSASKVVDCGAAGKLGT